MKPLSNHPVGITFLYFFWLLVFLILVDSFDLILPVVSLLGYYFEYALGLSLDCESWANLLKRKRFTNYTNFFVNTNFGKSPNKLEQ